MCKKPMAQLQGRNEEKIWRVSYLHSHQYHLSIPSSWLGGGREVAKPQSKSHIAPQELTSYRIDTSVGMQHENQGNRKKLTLCYKPVTCVLNTVRKLGWGALGGGEVFTLEVTELTLPKAMRFHLSSQNLGQG